MKGLGVVWEINSIYNRLYQGKLNNTKFIPILFDGSSTDDIPYPIKSLTSYRVSSEEGYVSLYRRLTNQPLVEKPPARARKNPAPEGENGGILAGRVFAGAA